MPRHQEITATHTDKYSMANKSPTCAPAPKIIDRCTFINKSLSDAPSPTNHRQVQRYKRNHRHTPHHQQTSNRHTVTNKSATGALLSTNHRLAHHHQQIIDRGTITSKSPTGWRAGGLLPSSLPNYHPAIKVAPHPPTQSPLSVHSAPNLLNPNVCLGMELLI